ncbi:MAG: zinc ABC transporter substrate-binding protein [Acidobacteria bacterium]|nr:zinc ABC transporter substrate-binding protein [Acidobacteriota bacterium]
MRVRHLLAPGLAGALTLLAACTAEAPGASSPAASPPPVAAATVAPLGTLLADVAGNRWSVRVLIPPGRSPHDYEPSPGDLRTLSEARLLLRVGHPSFVFEQRLLVPAAQRRVPLETLSVEELVSTSDEAKDPHPWLSPPVLVAASRVLGERLSELDPAGAKGYRQRAATEVRRFTRLDTELREILETGGCRTFLVDHPAWGAFAEHYGLEQLAIEHEGKDPGPATLTRTVEAARAAGVRRLLVRPGRPAARVLSVARSLGADTAELDPLAPDVEDTLRQAATLIAGGCHHE